ncbi:serine/threonine protein kinase [Piscinibacter sakaiensis]|uniref:Serine/threonine protein kinase n=1 Tax=Piscinibacter sakaiensis TaxID=1547922 RepID=A0A0K8P8C2_PISS1|nr:bifunctional serine/threonine-protein kinase/universal stress protein [Piscinibacter sakaiensis]GAP38886.1 serine/threonine protein kinase [Piscinibacter sakaiensis]
MAPVAPGTRIDGFVVGDCLHAGGMAHIVRVTPADGPGPGFPLAMKLPFLGAGDAGASLLAFEVEHGMLQRLQGPQLPRFVAAGDLSRRPYLVMEWVEGRTLQSWLDAAIDAGRPTDVDTVVRLGAALAEAVHGLHRQDAVHLDLKPANVIIRPDGRAVLIDFGLSWHAGLPDLLAEELRLAVGSPAYLSPEQVVGVRGDPRSDVFAIGVILYELLTGELPFGAPVTRGGLRQRLWLPPAPPRRHRPDLPEWLQEVVLRCLEPAAADRYPSAAHLAFDLGHPQAVRVGERGRRTRGPGLRGNLGRWLRAAGLHYQPSPLPSRRIDEVPIVMVALPWRDASDATLYALRESVARSLGLRPGARLACVSVLPPGGARGGPGPDGDGDGAAGVPSHRHLLARLHEWAAPLDQDAHPTSCHVLEHGDVARALLDYAVGNHVGLLVMGAATHGLALQPVVPTLPIRVAMAAPCTVMLVKPALPFACLGSEVAAGGKVAVDEVAEVAEVGEADAVAELAEVHRALA